MINKRIGITLYRTAGIALPLAICLFLLFPGISLAHAILLSSNPARNAVLSSAPSTVQMQFSEDLNPGFSTAAVTTPSSQRVDQRDAHVNASNPREIDLSLQSNLSPGKYIVIYQTQSSDDGHVLRGSFIFSVAAPDGTVPGPSNVNVPGQDVLGNGASSGQFDGPAFISFFMISLVDLGVVFWVGAQLWRTFVLQLSNEGEAEQVAIHRTVEQRFDRVFSLPTLLLIFLANIGILIGQALSLGGGQLGQGFSFSTITGLATNGRFGTYWSLREIIVLVALACAILPLLLKQRARLLNSILPWINLLLGLALLIAVTLSGHAAAAASNILVYSVVVDWLHLLAAALWIGGMLYIALVYLPVLRDQSMMERARSLLLTLPHYTPLAITGVVIMAASGPFNATVHMTSFDQLLTTAYGRTLLVKVVLVAALLITSAIHVGLLRPRLLKEYNRYQEELERPSTDDGDSTRKEQPEPRSGEIKQLEYQINTRTRKLVSTLRWEPLLGVAVLLCTGLLNVFASTLVPANAAQQPGSTPTTRPFTTTLKTSDNKYSVQLTVSPNRFGTNVFTATVLDSSGKVDTQVGVSVYTTMLDMDMGTDSINLQPDGKGHFSASGDLAMGGHWQLRVQIRTPDNTLHEATTKMTTPF